MKLRDGFYLERKDSQNIIKCTEESGQRLDNVITLNRSAAFLFKRLAEGEKTKEQLLNLMLDELEVSTVLALSDIDVFVRTMKENGIIEE